MNVASRVPKGHDSFLTTILAFTIDVNTSPTVNSNNRGSGQVCSPSEIQWEDAYTIIERQITTAGVHIWPFTPDFPIDVRFLRFGKQNDIRLNRHEYFELLYIYHGDLTYQVHDHSCHLKEGDLFVIGSTLHHRIQESRRALVKGVALYFMPELIQTHDTVSEDLQYLMPFLIQDSGFPHVVPAKTGIPEHIFDLMKRVRSELPAESSLSRLSVKTYLKMILVWLVNHYADYRGPELGFDRKQRDLEHLEPVFEFIDEHYAEPIRVDHAAALIHLCKSQFTRFFKQVTGETFVAHLNHLRVAQAQRLLATTDGTLAEIGQAVGFCDQSYFGAVFRKLVHMTPREYRNMRISSQDKTAAPVSIPECSFAADPRCRVTAVRLKGP